MSECLLNKTNSFPVSVSNGGTGVSNLTSGNILLGNGTGAVSSVATLPVSSGGTGATTLTSGNILLGNGTDAITSTATLDVSKGGTGATTLTSGNILLGNGTNAITSLATLTVAKGGTGATTFTSGNILVGSGTNAITSVASVPVANGGTGATTASGARINLELVTEYGTWTPTIANSATTQPTITNYYNRKGDYYVIGKLVYVSCAVKFRCSAYGDTYACINGLPYASTTVTTDQAMSRVQQYYATNTTAYPHAIVRAGESFMLLKDQGGFGYCTWQNYDSSHDQYIGFSGCYLKD